MDIPSDVSGHLDKFREGLLAMAGLGGLYLYGSLTTGDFSPASSEFTRWRLKVMTVAELGHSGQAVHGPWPPPGLPEISPGELRGHARDELAGYWRRLTYRPGIWLQDKWVDFALITAVRARQIMAAGIRDLTAP